MTEAIQELEKKEGAFVTSLKRNNRQIKEDRALSISEDAELIYKREIEDIKQEIKKIRRERENMLDLSPTNAQSLIVASDFKAKEYMQKDIQLGLKIRELEITLEIATERYKYLFGSN